MMQLLLEGLGCLLFENGFVLQILENKFGRIQGKEHRRLSEEKVGD